MKNALTFKPPHEAVAFSQIVTKRTMRDTPQRKHFFPIDNTTKEIEGANLYITSLFLNDSVLDSLLEFVFMAKPNLIFSCCRTLDEVGKFSVEHSVTPIGYLHKLGLLENAQIAGGIYLDKDDADLMVQSNASLILTPSYDAGVGNGIPPLTLYLDRKLKISLGTMDNSFNRLGDIQLEAQILRMLVNGNLCKNAISHETVLSLCG